MSLNKHTKALEYADISVEQEQQVYSFMAAGSLRFHFRELVHHHH